MLTRGGQPWGRPNFDSRHGLPRVASALALLLAMSASPGAAQTLPGSDGSGSASVMWGTSSGGLGFGSPLESAAMHEADALIAAQSQAAKSGSLSPVIGTPGSSINIQSIGSQTVISNTVIGDGNSANIDATQSSSNTGGISNSGSVNGKTSQSQE